MRAVKTLAKALREVGMVSGSSLLSSLSLETGRPLGLMSLFGCAVVKCVCVCACGALVFSYHNPPSRQHSN